MILYARRHLLAAAEQATYLSRRLFSSWTCKSVLQALCESMQGPVTVTTTGPSLMLNSWEATRFKSAMFAHAAIGKMHNLPVVMTTSAESGPNGPLPREFLESYPDVPLIQRPGQIDAWDNADFRDAVRATNKSQVIIAGITTDVCKATHSLTCRVSN